MKREQILEAARELFSLYGYKKVSMDEIARKAKVTKKTIYSYFKDKEELFQCLVFEEIDNMRKIIEKNEKQEENFIDRIHKTVYELLKYRKNAIFVMKMANDAKDLNNQAVINKLKMIDDSVKDFLREKIQIAIDKKYIKECDPDLAAFIIYKIYTSLMYEYEPKEKMIDEKEVSNKILTILKEGILN